MLWHLQSSRDNISVKYREQRKLEYRTPLILFLLRCIGESHQSACASQLRRDGRLRDRDRLHRAIDRPVRSRTRFSCRRTEAAKVGLGASGHYGGQSSTATAVTLIPSSAVRGTRRHLDRRNGFRRRTHHPLACCALRHRLRSEKRRRIRCIHAKQLHRPSEP